MLRSLYGKHFIVPDRDSFGVGEGVLISVRILTRPACFRVTAAGDPGVRLLAHEQHAHPAARPQRVPQRAGLPQGYPNLPADHPLRRQRRGLRPDQPASAGVTAYVTADCVRMTSVCRADACMV